MKARLIIISILFLCLLISCDNEVENNKFGTWEVVMKKNHKWAYKGISASEGYVFGWNDFTITYDAPRPKISISKDKISFDGQEVGINNFTLSGFDDDIGFASYLFLNSTDSTLVMKQVLQSDEIGEYLIFYMEK